MAVWWSRNNATCFSMGKPRLIPQTFRRCVRSGMFRLVSPQPLQQNDVWTWNTVKYHWNCLNNQLRSGNPTICSPIFLPNHGRVPLNMWHVRRPWMRHPWWCNWRSCHWKSPKWIPWNAQEIEVLTPGTEWKSGSIWINHIFSQAFESCINRHGFVIDGFM